MRRQHWFSGHVKIRLPATGLSSPHFLVDDGRGFKLQVANIPLFVAGSRLHRYRWAADRQMLVAKEAFMETTSELVYIVDDEANVGEALSTLLRANGKRVQLFTSGQDFLDFARRDSCACLILDLKMPGLGGLEVQKLISTKTSIPVIYLTGRGDIPSTVRAMKGGAVDFLTKPVDEEALLASVERALRQDRASRQKAVGHARLVPYMNR